MPRVGRGEFGGHNGGFSIAKAFGQVVLNVEDLILETSVWVRL